MPFSYPARLPMTAALVLAVSAALAQQGAPSPGGASETLRTASDLPGIAFTILDRLPRPAATRMAEFCRHYAATPLTDGGKAASAQGWIVTGEASLGAFTAVSFAGKFEPATSGTCFVADGNVGVFRGGRLVALAYVPRGSKLSIGRVVPMEGGAVRVWDGEPGGAPIADIRVESGGSALRLGALARRETLCRGRAVVPNIYGMAIDRARQALIQEGWAPVPSQPSPDERFGREAELRKRGMPEVESCSGTGFGYCRFLYRGMAGELGVTTMGEDDVPTVSSYGATCS